MTVLNELMTRTFNKYLWPPPLNFQQAAMCRFLVELANVASQKTKPKFRIRFATHFWSHEKVLKFESYNRRQFLEQLKILITQ